MGPRASDISNVKNKISACKTLNPKVCGKRMDVATRICVQSGQLFGLIFYYIPSLLGVPTSQTNHNAGAGGTTHGNIGSTTISDVRTIWVANLGDEFLQKTIWKFGCFQRHFLCSPGLSLSYPGCSMYGLFAYIYSKTTQMCDLW